MSEEPRTIPVPGPTLPGAVGRLVPWLIPCLVAVIGLAAIDVPLDSIVRYDVYFAGCVVVPGVLLLRALWRSTGNWAEDAALGATVGLAYQLAGWAIFTAFGWQRWLVSWPLLLIAAFILVPRLRRYWRIAQPSPLPVAWCWGVALAVAVMVFAVIVGPMAYHQAPPAGTSYYQDMFYHLSMVHELMRSVPPQLPQVAGESLNYHWFPNADMAAAVDITGASPVLVLYRLWLVPLVIVAVLLCAVLARQVSKVWWAGVLAAGIVAAPGLAFLLGLRRTSSASDLFVYLSPSQTFAVVTGTGAAILLIQALYRRGGPGVWALAIALAIVGGGSKPTVLPTLVGAVGLAAVFLLLRDRAVPWRSMLAGGFLLMAGIGTMLTVAGSTGGSELRLLAIARIQPGYSASTGDHSLAATGGWLLPALASGRFVAIAGVVVVLAVLVVGQIELLVGFGLLGSRTTRIDPVAWFLIGALTVGWLGLLVVDHPSGSQYYFIRGLVPVATAAAAWMVAVAVRGRSRTRREAVVVGAVGLLLGVLVVFGQNLIRDPTPGNAGWSAVISLSRNLWAVAVLGIVALLGWRRWLLRRPGLVGLGLMVPVFATIGISLAATVQQASIDRASTAPRVYTTKNWRISPAEQDAALWLGAHSGPTDVVATNTACQPAGRDCVARGYLVSGLAGRRTLLEGWAYTQQALAQHGAGGKAFLTQPSPWPERWRLTLELFTSPSEALAGHLRNQYGVRWIFADRREGRTPADTLGQVAVVRYQNADVTIYELRGPGAG